MEIGAREAARLLDLSEDEVYRLARTGDLPSTKVHDQYRFNRVELHEWASSRQRPLSPTLYGAEPPPSLHAALERGGVYAHVPGATREAVLKTVTELPALPAAVDRALLHQLLVAREALASTGIGDGIALPHPRDPLVVRVDEPLLVLCMLERPVEFGAIDGHPVRLLFMLLSPSVRDHLRMLARLSHALHDAPLRELLASQASGQAILERVKFLDAGGPAVTAPRR